MRYLESPAARRAYEALRQARRSRPYVPKRRGQQRKREPGTLEP
jgi:hypothetical protein